MKYYIRAALFAILFLALASANCHPSVTPQRVSSNSVRYVIVGCGSSSEPMRFTVEGHEHDLESVAFDAKPSLPGPIIVYNGDTSSRQSVSINAPQASAVFGRGTYSVVVRNNNAHPSDPWYVNLTITETRYSSHSEPEHPNNHPHEAERLDVNGNRKHGQVFPTFDVDWYFFELHEDRVVQILGNTIFDATPPHVGATFSLYNHAGATSGGSAIISTTPFMNQHFALQRGKYYISVRADVPLTEPVQYDISVRSSGLSCQLNTNLCFA